MLEKFFDWLDVKLHDETYRKLEEKYYRCLNRIDELEEELEGYREAEELENARKRIRR